MTKESINWVQVGVDVALVPVLSAAATWAMAHWSGMPLPLEAGLVGGSAALVAMGFLVRASVLRRKAEARLAAAETREGDATARAARAEAELVERFEAERNRQDREATRWPAEEAIRTELNPSTNVGAQLFRGQSSYGKEFSELASLVLRGQESRIQLWCRITNRAPFAVTPVGVQLDNVVATGLRGLRLKGDEPNVAHTYKELAPGCCDIVRVQMRVELAEGEAVDSVHLAVVGRVLVRSERWNGVQAASISTSNWGIIVDERPPKPAADEVVPVYRSPLRGGGF
jgi:hypothetical protein